MRFHPDCIPIVRNYTSVILLVQYSAAILLLWIRCVDDDVVWQAYFICTSIWRLTTTYGLHLFVIDYCCSVRLMWGGGFRKSYIASAVKQYSILGIRLVIINTYIVYASVPISFFHYPRARTYFVDKIVSIYFEC